MQLGPFEELKAAQVVEAARILREAIRGPSYKQAGEAEAEVARFLGNPDRFAIAALEAGDLIGWVGGVRDYPTSLQLHPLVVDPPRHRQGVGRVLVAALEARAVAEGYLAMHLGADDEFGGTTLFEMDAFPDPLATLATIAPSAQGHAFFFYVKLGFTPVGIIPDANGFGRPDLLLSKRLGPYRLSAFSLAPLSANESRRLRLGRNIHRQSPIRTAAFLWRTGRHTPLRRRKSLFPSHIAKLNDVKDRATLSLPSVNGAIKAGVNPRPAHAPGPRQSRQSRGCVRGAGARRDRCARGPNRRGRSRR